MTMPGTVWVSLAAVTMLWTAAAAEQVKPVCDPQQIKAMSPEKVEGEVVKIDVANGKVTIREPDGKSYEFFASQETLRDLKEGERLHATLRQAPKC